MAIERFTVSYSLKLHSNETRVGNTTTFAIESSVVATATRPNEWQVINVKPVRLDYGMNIVYEFAILPNSMSALTLKTEVVTTYMDTANAYSFECFARRNIRKMLKHCASVGSL